MGREERVAIAFIAILVAGLGAWRAFKTLRQVRAEQGAKTFVIPKASKLSE